MKKSVLGFVFILSVFIVLKANALASGIDIHLKSMTGQNLQTSYYNDKLLYITVFQDDCEYCQMEVPDLNKLYYNPQIRKWFIIMGINSYNSINGIKQFQKDYGVKYPLYQADMTDVLSMLHTEFTPTGYVILDGKILVTFYGKQSYFSVKHALEEIIQEVQKYAIPKN